MPYAAIDPTPTIDHTLLDPKAQPAQIDRLCDEAERFGFASVCVYPCYVKQAAERLHRKKPRVCTTIGFPSGATTPAAKLFEAQEAVEHGATELDVVINLGAIAAGNGEAVYRELAAICESTNLTVKAILEIGLLTPSETELAAEVCVDAGAAFLKTSTGWHGGATVEQVRFLKSLTKGRAGIKAAGGIRTLEQAIALLEAGASRLGTSRGVSIATELREPRSTTASEEEGQA